MKYTIMTMGCQLNENDSEKLCGMIEELGYEKTDDMSDSDLIVFNTCCVRENAEERLFGKLGEIKNLKEEKGTIIAVRWLYDARETYSRKDKEKLFIYRFSFWNSYFA